MIVQNIRKKNDFFVTKNAVVLRKNKKVDTKEDEEYEDYHHPSTQ